MPCHEASLVAQMVKNPPAKAGDTGLIPGSGRFPGEGNGNPLQYSCLGNLMDRGAWGATVLGVTKELDMTWQPNNNNTVVLHLFFKDTSILFSTVTVPSYIPINSVRGFLYSTPSLAFIVCRFFLMMSILTAVRYYEVYLIVVLICISLNN